MTTLTAPPRTLEPVVQRDVPLAPLTSLGIGGPARRYAQPTSVDQIADLVQYAEDHGLPWMVLGNGTNVLFPDAGFPGLIIHLGRDFSRTRIEEDRLIVQAGAGLGATMGRLRAQGYSDFDGLIGIPGSVGGALTMNAGGRETTIADSLDWVTALKPDGRLVTLSRAACAFGYRDSLFRRRNWVILEGQFRVGGLRRFDPQALMAHRRQVQPLRQPSPGCVFANPPGPHSAGQLLEQAGLKGLRWGGAMISPLHANFMINERRATAADLQNLIDIARERVYKEFGVELRLELVVVPN